MNRKRHNVRQEQVRDFFEEAFEEQAKEQEKLQQMQQQQQQQQQPAAPAPLLADQRPPPPPGPPPQQRTTSSITRSNSTPSKSLPVTPKRTTERANSSNGTMFFDSSPPTQSSSLSSSPRDFPRILNQCSAIPQHGFVATASTTPSPYASPRNSIANMEPASVGNSPVASPLPPIRSNSLPIARATNSSRMLRSSNERNITAPTASPNSFAEVDSIIYSLQANASTVQNTPTIRICIFHIIVAFEATITSSLLLRGASTATSDAVSLRSLLHPLLPANWRLVGRQSANDALYCIVVDKDARQQLSSSAGSSSSTGDSGRAREEENWLTYMEERWQNLSGAPLDTDTLFQGKNALLFSCPVTSLIVSTQPMLVFHESATRALFKIYECAQAENRYPYLVLLGGKSLKTTQRQSLARHLFDLGFAVYRVHWHGLSSKADSAFVGDIARLWHSLCVCK